MWSAQSGDTVYGPLLIDANGNYWFEQGAWTSWCGTTPISGVLDSTGAPLAGPVWVLGDDVGDDNNGFAEGTCRDTVIAVSVSATPGLTLTTNYTYHEDGLAPGNPALFQATAATVFALSPEPTPNLASAAGNWKLFDGSVMTITSDGAVSLTDTFGVIDCSFTGTVTLTDPAVDVYTVTGTSSAPCTGEYLQPDKSTSVIGVFTIDASGAMHGGLTANIMIPLDATR